MSLLMSQLNLHSANEDNVGCEFLKADIEIPNLFQRNS